MAVRAQHGKVLGNVVVHRDTLLERADRLQVMCLNKALTDRAIESSKNQITGLADGAMEFLCLFDRGAVPLDLPVENYLRVSTTVVEAGRSNSSPTSLCDSTSASMPPR